MDYTDATSAVEGGSGSVFAKRTVGSPTWPSQRYIGWDGTKLVVYMGATGTPMTYSPTQADLDGQDWIKGGDRPPIG